MGCCASCITDLQAAIPIKDKELNKIAACLNLLIFFLTCAALVQPSWFRIKGLHCTQSLSLAQFFSLDDDDDTQINDQQDEDNQYFSRNTLSGLPPCTTPEVIILMRVLILLCFMMLLWSCIGVLINVTSSTSKAVKMLRRNAVPSILCVFCVISIVGVCYYTTVVLSNASNSDMNNITVDYEYGFYTITATGAMSLLASAVNLWGESAPSQDLQRRILMDDWDGCDVHGVGPTPAVPTLPPYTPTDNYQPRVPTYEPPVLGTRQYFPFDDQSFLPPPPPYSP